MLTEMRHRACDVQRAMHVTPNALTLQTADAEKSTLRIIALKSLMSVSRERVRQSEK
jgi:hypothetical protein